MYTREVKHKLGGGMNIYTTRDEMFGTNLILCVGKYEEANQFVKENLYKPGMESDPNGNGYACTFEMSDGSSVVRFIWARKPIKNTRGYITLSHEINHTAFFVLQQRGVNDEETHCYYCDYLMNLFLDAIDKGKKKKTKKKGK